MTSAKQSEQSVRERKGERERRKRVPNHKHKRLANILRSDLAQKLPAGARQRDSNANTFGSGQSRLHPIQMVTENKIKVCVRPVRVCVRCVAEWEYDVHAINGRSVPYITALYGVDMSHLSVFRRSFGSATPCHTANREPRTDIEYDLLGVSRLHEQSSSMIHISSESVCISPVCARVCVRVGECAVFKYVHILIEPLLEQSMRCLIIAMFHFP